MHREPREGDARLASRPPPRVPPSSQDGILFGAVGAYDWDGAVLEESRRGRLVPPREAFEPEFPLELKNHAAYLGTGGGVPGGAPCPGVWDGAGMLLGEAGEPQHPRVAQHPGGWRGKWGGLAPKGAPCAPGVG